MKRLAIISFVLVSGLFILSGFRTKPVIVGHDYNGPARTTFNTVAIHPCYKHSIVPCGQWTPPAGYWLASIKAGDYYTSYSVNGVVHWTRKPVHISGELIWTNGKHLIRARCGNALSLTRPPEIGHVDTAEAELDSVIQSPAPEYPGSVFSSSLYVPPVLPPDEISPPVEDYPIFPPVVCTGCGVPVKTPESGYMFITLVIVGLAIIYKIKLDKSSTGVHNVPYGR